MLQYFFMINLHSIEGIMKKRSIIRLTKTERQALKDLAHKGKAAAYRRTHAQILLGADESVHGAGLQDAEIAERVGVHERTVSRLRQRCVEQGLQAALERHARKRARVLDGDGEAHLVALMCGTPPPGQARWTLHLAADRLVELGVVESISHEAVRQVLKKHL
jgi:transposase